MKASDIDSKEILRVVEQLCVDRDMWANTTVVAEKFPGFPFKVVASKLSNLLDKDYVTGCDCGCRGDWELTTKGREFAGIKTKFRNNPLEH